ncbi:hypothetical protein BK120_23105 [Paenibacillus sp. FSL A5-0031]|uniref:hypothetical protein n=1 Tax=Paenibacillus sp. FSL A5-0031 TaxID=1920420 RepID=UPI00096CE6C1|nr:hypothetical protein [Paenibacillus sp. FSL A5-0031]OME78630.1 hypothetical protein BK120_23105 [Paenibacillus sp. FSL A5-0031]
MSKNKKVIIASIGILIALIAAVLFLRTPTNNEAVPKATTQVKKEEIPEIPPPKDLDNTHEKIVSLVNDVGVEIANTAPSLWQKIVDAWLWFEVFPARYAVILLVGAVLIIGIITGGKNKRSQQGR